MVGISSGPLKLLNKVESLTRREGSWLLSLLRVKFEEGVFAFACERNYSMGHAVMIEHCWNVKRPFCPSNVENWRLYDALHETCHAYADLGESASFASELKGNWWCRWHLVLSALSFLASMFDVSSFNTTLVECFFFEGSSRWSSIRLIISVTFRVSFPHLISLPHTTSH